MVNDLVFCFIEVFCMGMMIIRYAHLNVENKWYSNWIMLLEYIGLVAVMYFLLLLYKIFTGN